MSRMMTAAQALIDILEAENAALDRLDLPGAAALLARKTQSLETLREAAAASPEKTDVATARTRLATLSERNRILLERALLVQGRVMASIARAVPRANAAAHGTYSRTGAVAARSGPVALCARA